jgi:hypothetical protein
VTVLPDDVGWLRCSLVVVGLASDFSIASILKGKQIAIFLLESDKSGSWAR